MPLPEVLDAWLERAKSRVAGVQLAPTVDEFGRIESVGDGIAFISGLPHARLDELLRFDHGVTGFVQTLDRDRIGCVLLDEDDRLEAGDTVRGTGEVVRVPVGPELLGRILDPLGRPLDGGKPIAASASQPIERAAPEIVARQNVTEPVQTGILVIDTLFPLGRGQRELIIGDRATGKTAVATDCIVNQKSSDMISIYVAIGQKSSSVKAVIEAVKRYGDFERCVFVVAPASAAPGLRWIAPFSGFTIAEYFRDRSRHALVVLDDLSKHAATHRELALLTRQPPGREAYPGDVFYVHARLLERATRLSEKQGGGTLTALPIAETDAGNLSGYIPTNLISITDGQIVLDAKLFQEGQKPAVDVGKSVSRVGGKTQAPALREAAESLRLDYAQFLELEVFTRFGGVTDTRIRKQVQRGRRIRALFTQPQYRPLDLAGEVALVLALQEGILEELSLEGAVKFRAALPEWLAANRPQIAKTLSESGALDATTRAALLTGVRECAAPFAEPPGGRP
jgi:F-type H+/Na+-transporting ATPase subunit alpha